MHYAFLVIKILRKSLRFVNVNVERERASLVIKLLRNNLPFVNVNAERENGERTKS